MKKIVFLSLTLLTLAACSPKTTATVEEVKSTEFPNTDVAEGNNLYTMHCGRCHGLKTVEDYNKEQWEKIVPNMAAKSKLDATQENKILQYVLWKIEQ